MRLRIIIISLSGEGVLRMVFAFSFLFISSLSYEILDVSELASFGPAPNGERVVVIIRKIEDGGMLLLDTYDKYASSEDSFNTCQLMPNKKCGGMLMSLLGPTLYAIPSISPLNANTRYHNRLNLSAMNSGGVAAGSFEMNLNGRWTHVPFITNITQSWVVAEEEGEVSDINDDNLACGWLSSKGAFILRDNIIVELEESDDFQRMSPRLVSNSGMVLGNFIRMENQPSWPEKKLGSAGLWEGVALRNELSPLEGFENVYAYNMNSSHDVVGYSWIRKEAISSPTLYEQFTRASLWPQGASRALALPHPSGVSQCRALGINDQGFVVGECWMNELNFVPLNPQAVLWTYRGDLPIRDSNFRVELIHQLVESGESTRVVSAWDIDNNNRIVAEIESIGDSADLRKGKRHVVLVPGRE